MPLTESAPDALARVYAQSLFELARAEGGGQARIEEVLGELEDILELARADARFGEFLASRVLPAAARAESLRRIFGGRVSPVTLNFLLVLNRKGRLGHLPAIAAAYDQIVQSAFGRVEVDVYTAAPLDPAQIGQLKERLRSVLGREPIVHPYTDPSMIGGLRLQIGDQLIDASIAARLRRLRDRLTVSGAAALRGRVDRIIGDGTTNGAT